MELSVVLLVVGILVALAIPNLRPFIQNGRLTSSANDLLRSFQLARAEAIKRQANVVVCASSNPTAATPTCSYGTFSAWIVFVDNGATAWQHDAGEAVLERHIPVDSTVTVKTDNDGIEMYSSNGFSVKKGTGTKNPTNYVLMCDKRGNQIINTTTSVERAFLIQPTGRAAVSTKASDVSAAAGKTGSCPS
jgi:type IV fimbrial biogenesis protein FimT